jgi:hypothetical protein
MFNPNNDDEKLVKELYWSLETGASLNATLKWQIAMQDHVDTLQRIRELAGRQWEMPNAGAANRRRAQQSAQGWLDRIAETQKLVSVGNLQEPRVYALLREIRNQNFDAQVQKWETQNEFQEEDFQQQRLNQLWQEQADRDLQDAFARTAPSKPDFDDGAPE